VESRFRKNMAWVRLEAANRPITMLKCMSMHVLTSSICWISEVSHSNDVISLWCNSLLKCPFHIMSVLESTFIGWKQCNTVHNAWMVMYREFSSSDWRRVYLEKWVSQICVRIITVSLSDAFVHPPIIGIVQYTFTRYVAANQSSLLGNATAMFGKHLRHTAPLLNLSSVV
jgi:hypothetical protein